MNTMKKNQVNVFKLFGAILFCTLCIGVFFFSYEIRKIEKNTYSLAMAEAQENFVFLSDLDYITTDNWSYAGWGSIQKDKNPEGKTISLKVDDVAHIFTKGIGIHAKGQLTYDISSLSNRYTRFISKIGVDASRTTAGSVWFQVFASNDGASWTSLYKSNVINYNQNAIDIDINVAGYKYLRIYIDPNGANTADHSVLANPRLVTNDFVDETYKEYDKIHPLEYYDNILSKHDSDDNYANNYRLILEREFVRKIGYVTIQDLANLMPKVTLVLDWILSDNNERLEQIIEVGELADGSAFLQILADLYNLYQLDLNKDKGFVYQKMMIGLAAAYTTDSIPSPLRFNFYSQNYEVMERFRLMKQLFDEKKLTHMDWFESYHVQLMRTIMQDAIRNDETLWLNGYITKYKNNAMGPYSYMGYVTPVYNRPAYFDEANRVKYDTKYHLSEYNVPYGDNNTQRYWMVFENGGICWNISRVGQSVSRTVGLPTSGLYQPGHEAYLFYSQDASAIGFWSIGNNISGWGKSATKWYGGLRYRMLFDWGNKYFANQNVNGSATGTSSGYMYLGQANLNDYE
ncbi:MAG: NPCBM/NEW2 domain-containing protein, partial [Bacilli bacterium]|nr:NPCBM/NEW2 domain-containing protein [Bacilli bacterium]